MDGQPEPSVIATQAEPLGAARRLDMRAAKARRTTRVAAFKDGAFRCDAESLDRSVRPGEVGSRDTEFLGDDFLGSNDLLGEIGCGQAEVLMIHRVIADLVSEVDQRCEFVPVHVAVVVSESKSCAPGADDVGIALADDAGIDEVAGGRAEIAHDLGCADAGAEAVVEAEGEHRLVDRSVNGPLDGLAICDERAELGKLAKPRREGGPHLDFDMMKDCDLNTRAGEGFVLTARDAPAEREELDGGVFKTAAERCTCGGERAVATRGGRRFGVRHHRRIYRIQFAARRGRP